MVQPPFTYGNYCDLISPSLSDKLEFKPDVYLNSKTVFVFYLAWFRFWFFFSLSSPAPPLRHATLDTTWKWKLFTPRYEKALARRLGSIHENRKKLLVAKTEKNNNKWQLPSVFCQGVWYGIKTNEQKNSYS